MPTTQIADGAVELHFRTGGSGPSTIVLIHGFPFTSELWDPQISAFADTHRVVAPDLRGFGASPLPSESYGIARLADDIAGLLDALQIDRAVIGGLSMGGYVTFEFFRRHRDRVAALVLADTRPDPDTPEARANRAAMARLAKSDGSAAVTGQLMPKLLAPKRRRAQRRVEGALRAMMDAAPPEAIVAALQAMAERPDSRPLLPEIDVPVLVTAGLEDQLTPPADTVAWARHIPDATVSFIEAAGHVPNFEQPDAFNALLAEFLAGDAGIAAPTEGGT